MLPNETDVLKARKAWADSQAELVGVTRPASMSYVNLGWHGTNLSDERGAFCLVRTGGPLEQYVGDVLRLRFEHRDAFVYAVLDEDLPEDVDLTVTRRAFAALGPLARDVLAVTVEVVE